MRQNTNDEEFTISRQIVSFSGVRARGYEPTINETKCYEESNYFLFRKSRREGWARGKWSQRGGEMNAGQAEGKHAERHAYDGLTLFCMN